MAISYNSGSGLPMVTGVCPVAAAKGATSAPPPGRISCFPS